MKPYTVQELEARIGQFVKVYRKDTRQLRTKGVLDRFGFCSLANEYTARIMEHEYSYLIVGITKYGFVFPNEHQLSSIPQHNTDAFHDAPTQAPVAV